MATLVDSVEWVTEQQVEAWVVDLDSWDTCDQLCNKLLGDTPFAWDKAVERSGRDEEFVKRASFALMAVLGWHAKDVPVDCWAPFFAAIEREFGDDRGYVKKAVNWALRNLGKRDPAAHAQALACARRIAATGTKAGRWIAADALKELESEAIRKRLGL